VFYPILKGFHLESRRRVAKSLKRTAQTPQLNVVMPIIASHQQSQRLGRASSCIPNVQVTLVGAKRPIPPADLVILPGSKSVQSASRFFTPEGWEKLLKQNIEIREKIIGICGAFSNAGEPTCLIH